MHAYTWHFIVFKVSNWRAFHGKDGFDRNGLAYSFAKVVLVLFSEISKYFLNETLARLNCNFVKKTGQ